MSTSAASWWEWIDSKVQAWHRDRLAVVYVRQSTAGQVADHPESTRLQYALAERAVALGWAPSRVLVIDEDLGHSASGADARPGFARLVFEVGLDHVGIVLGIEMSRLARSGREWHQLLELCALSGALLGDLDGVYDPAEHNDRLLLGLKGTISEAELHLIRQRMWSGRIAKARRGELAVPLPAGLVACGRCGAKMTVRYQRGPGGRLHPVYVCSRAKSDYGASQCQQLASGCADAHVAGLLLAA